MAAIAAVEALVFFWLSVDRENEDDKSTECDFHDRVSSDEDPLLKALRNLSTNRL